VEGTDEFLQDGIVVKVVEFRVEPLDDDRV
jgi:hypothetical protein